MGFLASANVASFSPPDPRISIPPPPNIIGCYQYLNISKSWMGTPCLSPSEANSITRPTEGGSATSNPIYGISVSSNVADFGYVWVDLHNFTAESDSCFGPNACSVQDNTNYFTGNNGQQDWVQFTIQELPQNQCGYGPYDVGCIWNVDVTTQNYGKPACVSLAANPPSSSFYAEINANTTSGSHLQGLYMVCDYGTCQPTQAVVTNDQYGLAGEWYQVSGTILGQGGRSEALFTSPTNQYTDVGIGAPKLTSASSSNAYLTGESNNLSYYWSQYEGCTGGECFLDTGSSN